MEKAMKQISLGKAAIASTAFACAALFSFGWAEQGGVSLSVDSAEARVGRPLTPVSVAGVGRRQARRAAYGYGAGVAGTGVGVAAVGTAAAVAATQPWGWGYGGTGYYGGAPINAQAAYYDSSAGYGGGPSCTPGTLYSAPDGLVQMCR
jgi:hypothetical protein